MGNWSYLYILPYNIFFIIINNEQNNHLKKINKKNI